MSYPPKRDMTISRVCPTPGCSVVNAVLVNEGDYWKWRRRDKIQDAMPYLTPSERERLITGICDECWDKMREDDEE